MQEEATITKQMEPIAIFGFDGHVPQGLKGNFVVFRVKISIVIA